MYGQPYAGLPYDFVITHVVVPPVPPPPVPTITVDNAPGARRHRQLVLEEIERHRREREVAEQTEREADRQVKEAFRRIAAGQSPYPEPERPIAARPPEELPPAVLLLLLDPW